jgi:hypothetical protein
MNIHGISAGWTQQHVFKGSTERDRNALQARLSFQLKQFLEKIRTNDHAWPFLEPVSAVEVSRQLLDEFVSLILGCIKDS